MWIPDFWSGTSPVAWMWWGRKTWTRSQTFFFSNTICMCGAKLNLEACRFTSVSMTVHKSSIINLKKCLNIYAPVCSKTERQHGNQKKICKETKNSWNNCSLRWCQDYKTHSHKTKQKNMYICMLSVSWGDFKQTNLFFHLVIKQSIFYYLGLFQCCVFLQIFHIFACHRWVNVALLRPKIKIYFNSTILPLDFD